MEALLIHPGVAERGDEMCSLRILLKICYVLFPHGHTKAAAVTRQGGEDDWED